jgi:hypothetical protein
MATAARSGRPRIIGYAESGPPVRAPTSQGSSACGKDTKVESRRLRRERWVGGGWQGLTRTAFTADDAPIEVNDMTFDGSAYTFVYDISTE